MQRLDIFAWAEEAVEGCSLASSLYSLVADKVSLLGNSYAAGAIRPARGGGTAFRETLRWQTRPQDVAVLDKYAPRQRSEGQSCCAPALSPEHNLRQVDNCPSSLMHLFSGKGCPPKSPGSFPS